jgi:glyoxylase-like metal-dependent hydrolase (beta-lactamase superfamily II)
VALTPVLFDAGNPGPLTGTGNNTWLLDGDEPALIDAGVGQAAHVDAIARHLGGRALARVLVTHGHADHASGVPALRERWPALEAWKFPGDGDGWRPLGDGQRVRAGAVELVVLHTPGHAPDHVCFQHAESGALFVGDMLSSVNTVMIPAGRGGHLRSYLSSLERLASLAPARAFPGHGPAIDAPATLIAAYLEHRRMRERQVLACLESGLTRADEMIARIYPGLDEAVRPAAVATLEAHLEKLREDGAIGRSV